MPKVTIIVSVHNPGKYLTPCLNSIVNQTFQDIEILLIDDGSTDGSRQILKDYESRDVRITAIFRRKGEYEKFGQKYSADLGRMLARGEYLLMMDHDDELMPDAIEKLYGATENGTIDVVQGRNISVNEDGEVVYRTPEIWTNKTIIYDINNLTFEQQCYHLVDAPIAVWACLIRSEFAKDIVLPDCIFNDASYIWELKIEAKSFCYLPEYIYKQNHHKDSTSGSIHANDNTAFGIFESFNYLEKFLKMHGVSSRIWLLYTIYKFRMEFGHGQGEGKLPDEYNRYMAKLKDELKREINIYEFIEGTFGPMYNEVYQELMS